MAVFPSLLPPRRLGTLPARGSAPPARFRASDRPAPAWRRGQGSTTRGRFSSCCFTMAGRRGPTRREENIMTENKAQKSAIRQRMAATGEPYSVARHEVEREHDPATGAPPAGTESTDAASSATEATATQPTASAHRDADERTGRTVDQDAEGDEFDDQQQAAAAREWAEQAL